MNKQPTILIWSPKNNPDLILTQLFDQPEDAYQELRLLKKYNFNARIERKSLECHAFK